MLAFTIVVVGQAISFIGTGMTRFAIIFWAWQETGQATVLAISGLFAFAPVVLVSPIAGALVDRWNRKLVMMLSDLAAGLSTVALLILFGTGHLQIWHLFIANAFAGAFESFQWPAFSAAITTMVPKEQYARANGMLSLAQSLAGIFAPAFAGGLLVFIGVGGIMFIDVLTFMFAIGTLLFVFVPQPKTTSEGREGQGGILQESLYGFRYILKRPSLLGLQLVFFAVNLTATFGWTVFPAMILARTNNNAAVLGTVESAAGLGGVIGGLLMSTWGGPKRRVHGVLLGMVVSGIYSNIPMGIGFNALIWGAAAFVGSASIPILNGSNQAIWQAKVAPDVQGRVFAVRRLIAQISAPVAMMLAGPLADYLFEPALMPDGFLAPFLGPIVGTGPGAGMGLMFILAGIMTAMVGFSGYIFPFIRNVETIMPDHEAEIEMPARATEQKLAVATEG
jgi:MFS family permease